MKTLLAVALLGALPAAAPAPVKTGMGTQWDADMPPIRFQGEQAVVVAFVNDVAPYCGTAPAGLVIIACTKSIDGHPVMILPNPCFVGNVDEYAKIVCHEKAHSLGWPSTHPE